MENYQNVLDKQNEYEKLKDESKIVKISNCKPKFKYVKSKSEIRKGSCSVMAKVQVRGNLLSFFA